MPNRSILHPNVEDPASQPASPRLGHPKPGQALILSFLLCRGSRSYPPFPILAGPPDPAGGRERAPCTASRGPAPPLRLPPPSLGGVRGPGSPRPGRALLCCWRRPGPAWLAVHCLRPAAHQLPTSRCLGARRGGPVLTCPFPSSALPRASPRGGQMCRLWCGGA